MAESSLVSARTRATARLKRKRSRSSVTPATVLWMLRRSARSGGASVPCAGAPAPGGGRATGGEATMRQKAAT